jgi:hypothetical protein
MTRSNTGEDPSSTVGLRVVLRAPRGEPRRRAFDALVGTATRARVERVTPLEVALVLQLPAEIADPHLVRERFERAGIEQVELTLAS